MPSDKVQVKKGYELVSEQLLNQIKSGVLKPGERLLSVTALAAQYGVGRSTIREALSALKAMGWINIRHGGGTFVNAVLPNDDTQIGLFTHANSLKEVLEVRKILETESAAMAAAHRNEDHLQRMQAALDLMAKQPHDEAVSEQADVTFHLEIVQAAQNNLLLKLMQSLTDHLQETIRDTRKLWFLGENNDMMRLLDDHQAIFAAIAAKDPALAAARMRNHLEKVEQKLLGIKPN